MCSYIIIQLSKQMFGLGGLQNERKETHTSKKIT